MSQAAICRRWPPGLNGNRLLYNSPVTGSAMVGLLPDLRLVRLLLFAALA
ncbi:hypothetical protein [Streptacidiphilus monticola]|uniref:Uncharacterized protein n=1 Tax=Streptacidiphilus monticola TaxID=2161674 RepID=A0ABW1GDV5_9ACTN